MSCTVVTQEHLFFFMLSRPADFSIGHGGILPMENEMTGYILTLLENYAKTTKEIELLRYELQHCNIVSPEEMIETLALSRRENNPDNSYPHDVAGIAMCFREVTDRLNKDASNEVAAQYVALVRERERLQYYISLLEHRESTALKEHYFFQKSWTEIAKNLGVTRRTVYKIRAEAIDNLASFYRFTKQVFRLS